MAIEAPLLAMVPDKQYVWLHAATEVNALGWVLEDASFDEIAAALRLVAANRILWTSEELARVQDWREGTGRQWRSLSNREREILRLLASGMDNAAIAEELALTRKTVESHVGHILEKLDLTSRLQAAVWLLNKIPASLQEEER